MTANNPSRTALSEVELVATAWNDFPGTERTPTATEVRIETERARFPTFQTQQIRSFATGTHGKWDDRGFLTPAPVTTTTPHLYPVVWPRFYCEDQKLEMMVRVAMFWWDGDEVRADGWRFETGDPYDSRKVTYRGHYRPHVQRVQRWWRTGPAGFTADLYEAGRRAPDAVPDPEPDAAPVVSPFSEVRPAIPLPSSSLAGLLLCAAIAVHGARAAQEIMEVAGAKFESEFRKMAFP
ncbi:hypothetical protein MARA_00570 (plasmid) [Mycolicibacterium arabiense]|uniref:Uncharacterized protein n=1 Tax=Mycolicibacterium arabiense TaxID=1286181 RepID=A0A7I7RQ16_9MYCO|nr:hypothetical protein [Mycolicibacterium arabiense]MCV7372043.1 hypothetical protein [Mycolicibacterium arabiense]BBY46627.1 hypothetical protein MARA_00570 [Mycolicibacterium arabiense]